MFKIIKATQFRRNARSVIDEVADAQTTYIVTRYGKPQAVLLTYAQYQQFFAATEPDLSGDDTDKHHRDSAKPGKPAV
jgi:prevent-host-death family protein